MAEIVQVAPQWPWEMGLDVPRAEGGPSPAWECRREHHTSSSVLDSHRMMAKAIDRRVLRDGV